MARIDDVAPITGREVQEDGTVVNEANNWGSISDAAVTTDVSASISSKMRGLVKIFADVWDGTLHFLKVQLAAGEFHAGEVATPMATPSATLTRPTGALTYASGQLIANSATAASVVPMAFTAARVAAGALMIRRVRLKKSGTTTTLATFRLHLYGVDPSLASGIVNGDGGVWLTNHSTYLGSFDLDMTSSTARVFSDGASVTGVPTVGSEVTQKLAAGQTVWGLLEARAAYAAPSAELYTPTLEVVAQS